MKLEISKDRFAAIESYIKGKRVLDIGCVDARNAFGIVNFYRILRRDKVKVLRHFFKVEKTLFTNRGEWYFKRHFYKLKYQIPKLISTLRSYFSDTERVIARQRNDQFER